VSGLIDVMQDEDLPPELRLAFAGFVGDLTRISERLVEPIMDAWLVGFQAALYLDPSDWDPKLVDELMKLDSTDV